MSRKKEESWIHWCLLQYTSNTKKTLKLFYQQVLAQREREELYWCMHRKDFLPLGSSLSFFWWFFKNWKPLFWTHTIRKQNLLFYSSYDKRFSKSQFTLHFDWFKLHCTARWRLFKLQSVYHINDLNIRIEVVPNFSIPPTEAYESLCTQK